MPLNARLVLASADTCPWLRRNDGQRQCGIVAQWLGPAAAQVPDGACQACCQSFPPSPEQLNPVVSSLLYRAADTIIACEGTSECDVPRARQVRSCAEASLTVDPSGPMVLMPARQSSNCCWLGHHQGETTQSIDGGATADTFACLHPRHRLTTLEQCRMCRDWSVHRPVVAELPLVEIVPLPRRRTGQTVHQWAIAVTTAPRRDATLEITLDSLVRAGFPECHLFLDGSVHLPERYTHLPVTWRSEAVGAWPAWYMALTELILRYPEAQAYMMLQDDVVLHDRECLRSYLEQALWPDDRPGIVSLFYSGSSSERGWFDARAEWHFSAQALLFHPHAARLLLTDADVMRAVLATAGRRHSPIPEIISQWAWQRRISVWYTNPSLVQHIGNTSVIWNSAVIKGGRRAAWYSGSIESDFGPGDLLDQFPEDQFPCAETLQANYFASVRAGVEQMRDRKVVVCGLMHNNRVGLPRMRARLERLGAMFADYRVVLVDTCAHSETLEYLHGWQAINQHIVLLPDDEEVSRDPAMAPQALANHRNRYWRWVIEGADCFDLAIVVDMDLFGGWSYEGIAHSMAMSDWDAIGSCSLVPRPLAPPGGRWMHADEALWPQGLMLATNSAGLVERGHPMSPVASCYGGLMLYRIDAFASTAYRPATNETIDYHQQMAAAGYRRIFVNPNQITLRTPI